MAPSRGHPDEEVPTPEGDRPAELRRGLQGHPPRIDPIIEGRSFTIRGVLVGLLVGLVICFSNMYFGLQTGWVSTMTMPASLMGFGIFKILSRHLEFPFSPVENVLVQTVAGSMAIMPLGCGFVGVLPAMNYLLTPEEQGPLHISLWKLVLWSLGLCYFGVVFAVPLRRQVIIRERLRFPSGFSTAVLIGVLHGQTRKAHLGGSSDAVSGGFASLVPHHDSRHDYSAVDERDHVDATQSTTDHENGSIIHGQDWVKNMRLLLICFGVSGSYTLCTYFLPTLRTIPIFGTSAAGIWLWTLNPSPAYIGQGIIMGPETTLHMLMGAVLGWGILSPLAKSRGWAPGTIDDWETGSKGWIVWISLAIMLADAVVSLGYTATRPLTAAIFGVSRNDLWRQGLLNLQHRLSGDYAALTTEEADDTETTITSRLLPRGRQLPAASRSRPHSTTAQGGALDDEVDAPEDQQISNRYVSVGLVLSILLCITTTQIVFGNLVPLYATIAAVLMALILSIMGVRALGETDLNPVSGISKLAQLFFALIVPQANKSSVLINLVAGAVSEAGALQAGDMMQDLKTGHLLGAAPNAQFWGQVIGATVGAVVSAFVYQLYTSVYTIPGDLFQVPTGYVWIFTARLVTGKGLPPMAREWAVSFGVIFATTTLVRAAAVGKAWRPFVPGGIAVAVGIYNVPSFTLARTVGGLLSWYWVSRRGQSSTPLIVLASGFILGEGFLSIVNLVLQSLAISHY